MRIQYILHADFELPGIIEIWAKQNKFTQAYCRPFANEALPDLVDFDLLIVMGGPQSLLNLKEAPYLEEEIALIKKAIDKKLIVLGFCLGAQLIGEALGACTEHSPNKEVGVFPIQLTEEGLKDPLLKLMPDKILAFHWHSDMPGLTPTAKILACSEGCPRQIIRYLPFVYGFQCHLEVTKCNVESMVCYCLEDLSPGPFVQSSEKLLSKDFNAMSKNMIQIMDNLIYLKNEN